MRILFYDPATPFSYTDATLRQHALGGTEATIIRVAHALAATHTVYVAQHCRTQTERSQHVDYIPLEDAHTLQPDCVIVLRQSEWLEKTAQQFPHAKLFFWMHNLPPKKFFSKYPILKKYQYEIIAVSQFHRGVIEYRLQLPWYQRLLLRKDTPIPIHVIYNPIDDHLQRDHTPWKKEQLLFLSSPQKGLAYTLRMFEQVLKTFPEYHLLIANPGHRKMDLTLPKQAVFLGELPHAAIMQIVRESFCVFYPQYFKKETFGLVYAEANAVGTPVLAHRLGAAPEVLSDERQFVDGRSLNSILEKIAEWRQQRLIVEGKNEFRLSHVIKHWDNVLLNSTNCRKPSCI